MSLLFYSHPVALLHEAGPGHPESPLRLKAVLKALQETEVAGLVRREAPLANLDQVQRVHPERFTSRILAAVPREGFVRLDADTVLNPYSGEAALRAAGAACAAVDAVMAGEGTAAFCAMRPPGHHAEPMEAMGFCVFNNVAVAALQARAVHKLSRLAIFDFDVHHGNGTQAIFHDDPDTLYASTHQSPLYPGTGLMHERGIKGNILNRPLPPGTGGEVWRRVVERDVLPAIDALAPADDLRLGRLRRPCRRSAGQHGLGGRGFRLGHPRAARTSPSGIATGALSPSWRAAMTRRPWRAASWRICRR